MDIAAMRNATTEVLERQLAESRAQLEELRFRASARELKNVHEIGNMRRLIARMLTVLHERRTGHAPASVAPTQAAAAASH
ncbi:MAG: 50S ribosomal protein L29 [bacterium]|nr:50S ribosomal protein L29 [bacterium]